ncbi:3-hydroxyacyl-CoA dehydrogenase family protein [Glutamicibacter sp. Je.9.36]|uniref:3-hydroxyacyl-CoA dehydrogenase family protein n=1 Tax=Glutamicibacter sp. Je.9.36 TaxID=3142837 RepID=UPI003DAA407F
MRTAAPIEHITVLGAGTMGSQIAAICALSGYRTTLVDIADAPLDQAKDLLWTRLERDVDKGRRCAKEVAAAQAKLQFATDRDAVVASTDFVIEAAVEDLAIKRQIFASLDAVAPAHAILATNSSNIVSSQIASATGRPDEVCNMHFFNPALVMKCVEIVPHELTSLQTMECTRILAESLGKEVVQLNREIPGFVANRLLNALRKEALNLIDQDIASPADIDKAARDALGHPMGPFELMDLVGLDVVYLIRLAEYEQTRDEASLPHPQIQQLYEEGRFGRKSGRGWYDYASA